MANESRRRRASGNQGANQGGGEGANQRRNQRATEGGGEQRSGPIAGTAVVRGVTFAQKGVQYAEVDGLAVFEGDIVLGTVEAVQGGGSDIQGAVAIPEESIGITGQQFRWPNATVPYDIDAAMPNQQRVTDAIAHWQANTPIRFVLRDASNQATYPDYMHFQAGGGCSSMVGRRGNRQDVTLGNGCTSGNAIHEIGHTVGLWHEQSREDRDSFVRIQWANIDPALSHNFDQHIADGDDLGAYDYGSIMHYPADAFSINGQPTIVALQTLPPGVVMGQRNGLSAGDIAGVRAMYPQAGTIKEVGKDPILDQTVKEVTKDVASDPTFKEVRKDPIVDPTAKEAAKDPIFDPTLKEVRKDPIGDQTIKELAKDPIRDPGTIKEVGRDPIGPGGGTLVEVNPLPGQLGQPQIGPFGVGVNPFVIAGASRAQDPSQALNDAIATAQQLGAALGELEQQYGQLAEAYAAAVANVEALSQGQG